METNNFFFNQASIIQLDAVDSTNNYAMQCLQQAQLPAEGTMICATTQLAGRGQRGNEWQAASGKNITCSIILYPHQLLVNEQFVLSQAMAIAVYDLVKTLLPNETLQIKWPNDVYVGQQKLGGLLIENIIQDNRLKASVVGIGLNVNQIEFPPTLTNPISLKNITKNDYNLDYLLKQLIWHIAVLYLQVMTDKVSVIRQRYLSILYGYEQWCYYREVATKINFWAKILGVQNDGRLILETEHKGIWTVDIKEVQLLLEHS